MATLTTTSTAIQPATDLGAGVAGRQSGHAPAMSLEKLANLNLSIFRSLCSLGTERERICAVLGLESSEFEYLLNISPLNKKSAVVC